MAAVLLVLVGKVGLGGGDKSGEFLAVLAANILEGQNSSGLLMDDGAEASLGLDDNIRHTHLAAESREEDDELNRVDIVGNDNEVRLLGLDEGDGVVEPVLDVHRLLGVLVLGLLGLGGGLGSSINAGLLLLLGLGAVLVQKLEQLGRRVLVKGVVELSDSGRDLEALVEDDLLALEADVFGPLDKASKVRLVLDVLTDTKVARAGLEERVLRDRLGLAARSKGSCGGLLSGLGFWGLVIEQGTRSAIVVVSNEHKHTVPCLEPRML